MATEHNLGTSGVFALSNLVPSIHSVTITLEPDKFSTTAGAVTETNPLFSMASIKFFVFDASSL